MSTISVDRLDHAPIASMVALGDTVARGRGDGRHFYGWAVVKARDARAMGRSVVADPLLANRFHANVVLPVAFGPDADDAATQHAQDLALLANLRPRPQSRSSELVNS